MKERQPGIYSQLGEEEIDILIERARKEPQTFGKIYDLVANKVFSYIYSRLGSTQDAEDLTATVFIKALTKLETYEKREGISFRAWVFRIAHNTIVNFTRDKGKRKRETLLGIFSAMMRTEEAKMF